MNAFTLGRMRHIELLQLWWELHPNSREDRAQWAAAMSKEQLAAAILAST